MGGFLVNVWVSILFDCLFCFPDPIFSERPLMSLLMGLIAAVSWGIHDLCVRYVSQSTGIFASIIAVLAFGCILVAPISVLRWGEPIATDAMLLSLLSGALFGLAAIAHYKAFSIGPVRLVAPIVGSYPILSVGWAAMTGTPVSVMQWMAVGVVISGVGYVAASGDQEAEVADPKPAILWSIAAATGFASTFYVGQAAVAGGDELALLAPTRFAALIIVLVIAIVFKVNWRAKNGFLLLALMGVLDTIALGSVISAGGMKSPEFASVAASIFGLITVLLAAIFLGERMTKRQFSIVAGVFVAIGYLSLG